MKMIKSAFDAFKSMFESVPEIGTDLTKLSEIPIDSNPSPPSSTTQSLSGLVDSESNRGAGIWNNFNLKDVNSVNSDSSDLNLIGDPDINSEYTGGYFGGSGGIGMMPSTVDDRYDALQSLQEYEFENRQREIAEARSRVAQVDLMERLRRRQILMGIIPDDQSLYGTALREARAELDRQNEQIKLRKALEVIDLDLENNLKVRNIENQIDNNLWNADRICNYVEDNKGMPVSFESTIDSNGVSNNTIRIIRAFMHSYPQHRHKIFYSPKIIYANPDEVVNGIKVIKEIKKREKIVISNILRSFNLSTIPNSSQDLETMSALYKQIFEFIDTIAKVNDKVVIHLINTNVVHDATLINSQSVVADIRYDCELDSCINIRDLLIRA